MRQESELLLTPEEVKQVRFQCRISEGYGPIPEDKVNELAMSIAKAQLAKVLPVLRARAEKEKAEAVEAERHKWSSERDSEIASREAAAREEEREAIPGLIHAAVNQAMADTVAEAVEAERHKNDDFCYEVTAFKAGKREERKRILGELEDIRCCASGDYLPGIERLMLELEAEK